MPLPSRPLWQRLSRRVVTDGIVIYAIVSCAACAVVNRAMFHPPRPVYGEDIARLVTMGPPDAPVAGVWMPVEGATRAVLFAHGNAEDIRHVHDRLHRFNLLGYSALAYDYPGYGLTPGQPTESSVYAAAETAFRHLVEERGFAESNIVVCGFSIGSGPACYLAEKHDVRGLLLYAPFKSAIRVVTRIRLLPIDPFPNLARISRTRCPVLVLHGTADKVIPSSHGRAIAAAAGDRGRYIEVLGADHDRVSNKLSLLSFRDAFETAFGDNAETSDGPVPEIEIFEAYDEFGVGEYPGGWYDEAGKEIGSSSCIIQFRGVKGALKTSDGGPPRGFQLTNGIQTTPLRAELRQTNEVEILNESRDLGPGKDRPQRRILYGHDPDNPGNLLDGEDRPVQPFSVPVVWCGA